MQLHTYTTYTLSNNDQLKQQVISDYSFECCAFITLQQDIWQLLL